MLLWVVCNYGYATLSKHTAKILNWIYILYNWSHCPSLKEASKMNQASVCCETAGKQFNISLTICSQFFGSQCSAYVSLTISCRLLRIIRCSENDLVNKSSSQTWPRNPDVSENRVPQKRHGLSESSQIPIAIWGYRWPTFKVSPS